MSIYDDENELENEGTESEPEEEPVEILTRGGSEEPESEDTESEEEENDMADPTPTPRGKLPRGAYLLYIQTDFDFEGGDPTAAASANWFVIGKDVSDLSVELNSDTEVIKNILDETSVVDNGYEPSFDVDTYYAAPTDGAIYTHLKDIMMNRKTGDACRTRVLEVLVDQDNADSYDAWVEEVIVKPTSYGGEQGGVRIPYNVSFAGNRVKGTVTYSGKVPTFVPPQS